MITPGSLRAIKKAKPQSESPPKEVQAPPPKQDTTPPSVAETNPQQDESSSEATPRFQAIGLIQGEVSFSEEGKVSVALDGQSYPLFYIPGRRAALTCLRQEINKTGNSTQQLIVYPRVTHFPQRNKPQQVTFQLVGFERGERAGVAADLENLEFKLCGLWQFIPVCRVPCVSVFKNFTKERLQYVKEAAPAQRVRFLKPSHVPLIWKDAPVAPFRFNPKAEKEDQGSPAFVQVKAKFVPQKNVFVFDSLLAPPIDKPPNFLKASKQDKQSAHKSQAS